MKLTVNGTTHDLPDIEPEMPLLWVLRDILGLHATKYGCGVAQCGACTVHLDGVATRSCQLAIGDAVGTEITTLDSNNPAPTTAAVTAAWLEHQVAQCGYCQSGQIMAAASFLQFNADPTDADIDAAMSANLCRCGTYPRIRAAIKDAARRLRQGS